MTSSQSVGRLSGTVRWTRLGAAVLLAPWGVFLLIDGIHQEPGEGRLFRLATTLVLAVATLAGLTRWRARPGTLEFSTLTWPRWTLGDSFAVALVIWSAWCWGWSPHEPNSVLLALLLVAGAVQAYRVTRGKRRLVLEAQSVALYSETGHQELTSGRDEVRLSVDPYDRLRCHAAGRTVMLGRSLGKGLGGGNAIDAVAAIGSPLMAPASLDRSRALRGIVDGPLGAFWLLGLFWVALAWWTILAMGGLGRGAVSFAQLGLLGWSFSAFAAAVLTYVRVQDVGDLWREQAPASVWMLDRLRAPSYLTLRCFGLAVVLAASTWAVVSLSGAGLSSPSRGGEDAEGWLLFFAGCLALSLVRREADRTARRVMHALTYMSVEEGFLVVERPMALDADTHPATSVELITDGEDARIAIQNGPTVSGARLGSQKRWVAFSEAVDRARAGVYR